MSRLFLLLAGILLLSQPPHLVAQFIRSSVELQTSRAPSINTAAYLQSCCEKIKRSGPSLYLPADRNGRMRFRLLGIYSHGPTLFFRLRLNNRSSLDYDIDSIRFCITAAPPRGHSQSKPASPVVLQPVYIYDSTGTVPGYRRVSIIYALPRFTLPPGRQLLIIVGERNGGRGMRVQTNNFWLERARPI